jgi:hypothetical protein
MRYTERFELRMTGKMLTDLSRMARYDESISSCIRRILRKEIKEYKQKRKRMVKGRC